MVRTTSKSMKIEYFSPRKFEPFITKPLLPVNCRSTLNLVEAAESQLTQDSNIKKICTVLEHFAPRAVVIPNVG